MNFTMAMDQWLRTVHLGRKPATQVFYNHVHRVMLQQWPEPEIEIEAISVDLVLSFAGRVSHYSPSLWNAIVGAVKSVTPAGRVLKRRTMRARQFSPPSTEQWAQLLEACDQARRSHAGLVVRFLAFTGLRISEARALTWADVQLDCLTIPGSVTKNGQPRSVPLVPGADAVLDGLRTISRNGRVLPPENPRKAIEAACDRIGIPRMSFHCFRHLFATRCIQSGVDLPTAAHWLGHLDGGALLARTYFHHLDDHSRRMAARVRL